MALASGLDLAEIIPRQGLAATLASLAPITRLE